jgi:NADH dehydrogenase
VEADVLDRAVLERAFAGAVAVVHLAALTSSAGRREDSFKVNVAGSHCVASAARAAGVGKFIFLGSQAYNVGEYATTKRKAEAAIRTAGVEPIILRPSLVYGRGEHGLFARIVELVELLPVVPLIGGGRYSMRPIYVDDVAAAILGAVQHGVAGASYDLSGGTEVLFRDFLVAIGKVLGHRLRFIHVPPAPILVASTVATRLWKGFPVSPDMILGLTNPLVLDGGAAERALGFRARPLEEGLKEALV